MPARRTLRRPRRGLTLIELLVVISILGLIAAVVGLNVQSAYAESQTKAARIQLSHLSEALGAHKVRLYRYPSTEEGLAALVAPAKGQPIMQAVPTDPWGAEYVYVNPDPGAPSRFLLKSKGPDGVEGTEDDVR